MNIKKILRNFIDYISHHKIIKILLNTFDVNTVFLNYHSVIKDCDLNSSKRPNDDLVVTVSVFEQQIKFLTKHFDVISINEIEKSRGNQNIIITFDDGYMDNYENALPILKKYNCPAIVYVATNFINNKEIPWWIKIWKLISNKEKLVIDNKLYEIKNNRCKSELYNELSQKYISLKTDEINNLINEIIKANDYKIDKDEIFLTTEKLVSLSKNKLIDIGCHTHKHPNLRILNKNEIDYEIYNSIKILEETIKKKIIHFSIPFGTKKTFSNQTIKEIKKYNFKTIVTTEHGIFNKNILSRIPRIGIGNKDLENRLFSKAIGLDSLLNKILLK
jgi:peptidoglycan/xylan/chitin deacetylase (PgdA/CDA1 family)